MTPPRSVKHDTSHYVTVRAVNRSFRFVPRARIRAAIDYVLATVLAKYREDARLRIHRDGSLLVGDGRLVRAVVEVDLGAELSLCAVAVEL